MVQRLDELRQEKRAIAVHDCVILNDCEMPSGEMVAVVVGERNGYFLCKYLNADKRLDRYNRPPMQTKLERATRIEDFGVTLRIDYDTGRYWCEKTGESTAFYHKDGKPRLWQEREPMRYRFRREVAAEIMPF